MEPSGRNWWQPVANRDGNGSNSEKPLPWVATSCLSRSMVKEGVDAS
jgi:hypothetical protein